MPRWTLYLGIIEKPFYLLAIWAFSAQYLKTSLVLPRILKEAKLELEEETIMRINRMSSGSSGIHSYEVLKDMDDAITCEKKQIRKIKIKIIAQNVTMLLLIVIYTLISFPFVYLWL